jgi:hypothetical protein
MCRCWRGRGCQVILATVPVRTRVDFQVERWATYAPDAEGLWPLHWQEVALTQEAVPLDMDVERYAALDAAGILHIVTGRDAGRLVAYHTSLIMGHLHYKSTLHALVDLFYVHPLWRRGTTALRLFGTAHRALKQRGVVKVMSGTKLHSGLDMTRLFIFMGYELAEHQFTKLL